MDADILENSVEVSPAGTFKTAIIDPPWPYDRSSNHSKLKGYADKHYKLLSIEDLAKLPIGQVVTGYIFIWTVGPFIRESLDLLTAWGFDYVTQMCWYKNTGIGVGYWFRGDHELVLVGKKAGNKSIKTGQRSLFASPRLRHSEKPSIIHEICESKFEGPYLEVFGRKARPGWTVLGNESPDTMGEDITESLAKLIERQVNQ